MKSSIPEQLPALIEGADQQQFSRSEPNHGKAPLLQLPNEVGVMIAQCLELQWDRSALSFACKRTLIWVSLMLDSRRTARRLQPIPPPNRRSMTEISTLKLCQHANEAAKYYQWARKRFIADDGVVINRIARAAVDYPWAYILDQLESWPCVWCLTPIGRNSHRVTIGDDTRGICDGDFTDRNVVPLLLVCGEECNSAMNGRLLFCTECKVEVIPTGAQRSTRFWWGVNSGEKNGAMTLPALTSRAAGGGTRGFHVAVIA